MEPLTTQTFSGDEIQAPATSADSLAALPALPDETHAVPFRDFGISARGRCGLSVRVQEQHLATVGRVISPCLSRQSQARSGEPKGAGTAGCNAGPASV